MLTHRTSLLALCLFAPAATAASQGWVKMPLLSPAQRAAGIAPGGEGGQWPRDIVISESNPDFLILPIDVGGLWRTTDGGKNWRQATVGWNARGCNTAAIDPRNPNRVLGVAGNSSDWNAGWGPSPHGLYLSTDRAASWRHVLGALEGKRGAVAFEPASYDAARGFCTVAYYANENLGLFRSDDGGETWRQVSAQPVGMGADGDTPVRLKTHPTRAGVVYLGGKTGFFRSEDGGRTFAKTRDGDVWGMAVVTKAPDDVYISGTDGLLVSHDTGRTWAALPAVGLDRQGGKPVRDIAVSPADPSRMSAWVLGDNWKWVRFTSHDAGATFQPWKFDLSLSVLPNNERQGRVAWSPADPNVAFSHLGDAASRSDDGGRTFRWWNNGNNGIMLGGLFNFSPHSPDTVFLAFQDYNGAFTADGGKTWGYRDVSGKGWGGQCYGGFAVDRRTMWYGDAEGWGSPRTLRITRDGGDTWSFVTGPDGKPAVWTGPDVSLCDPADPKVLFASNWRSADGGATWAPMDGCDGVYTYSPKTKALFGRTGSAVVRSDDHGATWTKVADTEGGVDDIAVDHLTGRVYVASQERLKVWEGGKWTTLDTPKNQRGGTKVTTVAVDPKAPNVLYVGGPANIFASFATVCRSTDGGKTWTNLSRGSWDPASGETPREVSAIRVNPTTRWAWVNGQCHGMWRIAPPAKGETGVSAENASAPPAGTPPAAGSLR